MKTLKIFLIFTLLIISIANFAFSQQDRTEKLAEECTIGVAAGKATADGRPLLWKTRDFVSRPDNEIDYNDSYKYNFIAVVNAGATWVRMGVNEKGFAIVNSTSSDLERIDSGYYHGELMRHALGNCNTIADFEQILINTNSAGRHCQSNMAIIDAAGGAAIFEVAGYEYWMFDANDSTVAPDGFLLRTNFAFNGYAKHGLNDWIYSIERYRRQNILINNFLSGDTLNYKSILRTQMRDFSDYDSNPVTVPFPDKWYSYRPYGYINTDVSICRHSSVSSAVIQGVLPDEEATLTTMWTILGQPASGIAAPYWPVGSTPSAANGSSTAPLCDVALDIKSMLFDCTASSYYVDSYKLRNDDGDGVWKFIFSAEDSILIAANNLLSQWRSNTPTKKEMLSAEKDFANYALIKLRQAYNRLTTSVTEPLSDTTPINFSLDQNYPNPFNPLTTIPFSLQQASHVTLKIFNLLGEEVTTILSGRYEAGQHFKQFKAQGLASGVYFYRIHIDSQSDQFIETKKLIISK